MQIQYLVSHLGRDVNSLGLYSYDTVGKPHDLYDKLRITVDNLFFAGEATSSEYLGSVHIAYSTGLMSAHQCFIRYIICIENEILHRYFMDFELKNALNEKNTTQASKLQ